MVAVLLTVRFEPGGSGVITATVAVAELSAGSGSTVSSEATCAVLVSSSPS
ncbi:MAG: hypothetical protein U0R72_02570 [Nakamurella multipartita]